MRIRLHSSWQKIKKYSITIRVIIAIVLGIALIVVFILGYWFNRDWTGLGPYTLPTNASNFQRGKTLWDWLQLLIVPIMLAIGGFWLNQIQKNREEKATEERTKSERELAEKLAQTEREILEDTQREAILQDYFDKMSVLLLEKHLRDSEVEYEARTIARARTLTVLPRLDGKRKKSLLQFLQELGLIDKDHCVIDLYGANLREAFLPMANLSEALLGGTTLSKANLIGANLVGADLRDAMINDAKLFKANLTMANLSGALLSGSELSEVNLEGANLKGAILIETDLSRANLDKADLSEVFLSGANLTDATLRGTILRGAKLRGGQLPDASVVKDADLCGANLQGTDLRQAIVTTEQLEKAQSLKGAIMPDGSKHP